MQRRIASFFYFSLYAFSLDCASRTLLYIFQCLVKKKVESIEEKDDKKLRERGVSFFALEVRGSSGKKIDKTRNL